MAVDEKKTGKLPPGEVVQLGELVRYADDAIVSRTLCKGGGGTITLFAFDAGQGLSEHTAPFDALVQVLDGGGAFTVGGRAHEVAAGQSILMPADVPHAVHASRPMTMLLTMIRP